MRQVNSNFPCKFGHFWRKLNFWVFKTPLLNAHSAQTRYDVVWNFMPIFRFSTLHISYVKMATSQGGRGGVCIYLVGLEPNFTIKTVNINDLWKIIFIRFAKGLSAHSNFWFFFQSELKNTIIFNFVTWKKNIRTLDSNEFKTIEIL